MSKICNTGHQINGHTLIIKPNLYVTKNIADICTNAILRESNELIFDLEENNK